MIRRSLVLGLMGLAVSAAPSAAQSSGGAVYAPAPSRFSVTPATFAPGATVTFTFRLRGTGGRVRARIDLLSPGRTAVRERLGLVRVGRLQHVTWAPPVSPGAYTARLVVTGNDATAASALPRVALTVVASPQAPVAAGVFPVQGAYTFGDPFGVGRPGHIHQGQDILAASGTPIVAPLAGSVLTTDFQAGGAGYYVVVDGADGRAYVFMHLLAKSTAVATGQAVAAGQRLGLVGATGDATGPHLHFEIWTSGWHASAASQPIDPMPDLEAWAAAGAAT